jgi:hypothetical protein
MSDESKLEQARAVVAAEMRRRMQSSESPFRRGTGGAQPSAKPSVRAKRGPEHASRSSLAKLSGAATRDALLSIRVPARIQPAHACRRSDASWE